MQLSYGNTVISDFISFPALPGGAPGRHARTAQQKWKLFCMPSIPSLSRSYSKTDMTLSSKWLYLLWDMTAALGCLRSSVALSAGTCSSPMLKKESR